MSSNRVLEGQADRCLMPTQERHVEGGIVGDQDRPLAEAVKSSPGLRDVGRLRHHGIVDAVDPGGGGRNRAAWMHEAVEDLAVLELTVDDPQGGDLNDLVAFFGLQPGGFGVEDHIGKRG